MAMVYDVVIIGGGAIGLSAAHYLERAGRQVLVLDKGQPGSGCSEGNAGLVVPSHVVPLAAPGVISQGIKWLFNPRSPFYIKPRFDLDLLSWIWRFRGNCSDARMRAAMPVLHGLLQASHGMFPDLIAEAGLDVAFEERGLILTWEKEKGYKDCLRTAELSRQSGLQVDILEGEVLRQREPGLHEQVQGGVFFPQDAHLDPARFCSLLADSVRGRGVEIMAGTTVTGIQRVGRSISTVVTERGNFKAQTVVLCGGAWSPYIMPGVKLPVQAGKGYSVTLPARGRIPKIPLILSEAKVSVTPLGDQIRFGGTLELAGLDPSVNRRRASSILQVASQYVSDVDPEAFPTEQVWWGYRPCTPDGLPIIGRYPSLDNLVVACGHAMIGISLAPVSGRLVSEVVTGQQASLDLVPLSAARFL